MRVAILDISNKYEIFGSRREVSGTQRFACPGHSLGWDDKSRKKEKRWKRTQKRPKENGTELGEFRGGVSREEEVSGKLGVSSWGSTRESSVTPSQSLLWATGRYGRVGMGGKVRSQNVSRGEILLLGASRKNAASEISAQTDVSNQKKVSQTNSTGAEKQMMS